MIEITKENVDEVFAYHAPTGSQVIGMNNIREAAKGLALAILEYAPRVPDRTRALNTVSDVTMLANKAIILEQVR